MKTCSVEGCGKASHARGLCNTHYNWSRRSGVFRVVKKTVEQRFWDKTDFTPGCWNWKGHLSDGYGRIGVQGRCVGAHVYSYQIHVGPVPEGMVIDHLCRKRSCVNWMHMQPVTLVENVMRGESMCANNARKTHCVNGHEFNEKNTHKSNHGRNCRMCSALRMRRYKTERDARIAELEGRG